MVRKEDKIYREMYNTYCLLPATLQYPVYQLLNFLGKPQSQTATLLSDKTMNLIFEASLREECRRQRLESKDTENLNLHNGSGGLAGARLQYSVKKKSSSKCADGGQLTLNQLFNY